MSRVNLSNESFYSFLHLKSSLLILEHIKFLINIDFVEVDMTNHPKTITDANFDQEVLKSEIPVLVDFWAEWCYPCKMVAPVVEEISKEYAGKIKVGKLDTDQNQYTAMQYGISGIPTLLIFQNGEIVDRIVGAVPKQNITQKLNYYISAN